jgi:hypothetical protein
MAEEKPVQQQSWANVPQVKEEDIPEPKDDPLVEASIKVESLRIQALYNIVKVLEGIREELRLQRILYEQVNDASVTIEEVKDTTVETNPAPRSRSEDSPKPVPIVIPTNLKSNKEIEDFYRTVITESGILDEKQLGLLMVAVEENYVRVKPPFIADAEKFKAIAKILRAMGGEYVPAGANTHYKMPKPATS